MAKRTNDFLNYYNSIAKNLEAELAAVYKKHGITMQQAGGKFGESFGEVKFKLSYDAVAGGKDPTEVRAREDFKHNYWAYGLKLEHLDKEVILNQEVFTIVGLMPKKQKYPILVQRKSDGVKRLYPADYVAKMMGA